MQNEYHNFHYTYNTVEGSLEKSEPPIELTNHHIMIVDKNNEHLVKLEDPKLSFNPILWEQIKELIAEEVRRQLQEKDHE